VYIVETPEALAEAPSDSAMLRVWLGQVPMLSVDGTRPNEDQLAERLRQFWVP